MVLTNKSKSMEEKKTQNQSANQKTVECSKCHKHVSQTEGEQTSKGFVCTECSNKAKKKKIIAGGILTIIVVAAIGSWFAFGNSQRTGEGFSGVGEVSDSMALYVDSNKVSINLATMTAASSSVSTQAPVSNLADFKHQLDKNVDSASKGKEKQLVIPSVSPLFEINTNYFAGEGEALVKEFASAFAKTNKEAKLLVEGYTCDLGGNSLNENLSKSRAEAVKNVLVQAGVPEGQIEIKWYGKSRFKDFKYSDKSEYRRVVLSVK